MDAFFNEIDLVVKLCCIKLVQIYSTTIIRKYEYAGGYRFEEYGAYRINV